MRPTSRNVWRLFTALLTDYSAGLASTTTTASITFQSSFRKFPQSLHPFPPLLKLYCKYLHLLSFTFYFRRKFYLNYNFLNNFYINFTSSSSSSSSHYIFLHIIYSEKKRANIIHTNITYNYQLLLLILIVLFRSSFNRQARKNNSFSHSYPTLFRSGYLHSVPFS